MHVLLRSVFPDEYVFANSKCLDCTSKYTPCVLVVMVSSQKKFGIIRFSVVKAFVMESTVISIVALVSMAYENHLQVKQLITLKE